VYHAPFISGANPRITGLWYATADFAKERSQPSYFPAATAVREALRGWSWMSGSAFPANLEVNGPDVEV
jgi:hypothetical protein